ncbi:hypothetical protein ACX818_001365 [Acinetobacter baumannii]
MSKIKNFAELTLENYQLPTEDPYAKAVKAQIDKAVYQLTYSEYCERFSTASYEEEIEEAKIILRTLCETANLGGSSIINPEVKGYLGISVDLSKHGLIV